MVKAPATVQTTTPETSSDPIPESPPTTTEAAPTTTPAPAEATLSSETTSDVDATGFDGLGEYHDDIDDVLSELAAPAAETPTPTLPSAPDAPVLGGAEKAPAVAQTQPGSEPQKAPETPPTPTQTTPAPQTSTGGQDPAGVDGLLQVLKQNEQAVFEQVLPAFALTEAQVTALETDAATEVPKLLASTYLRSVGTALKQMRDLMPGMIQQQVSVLIRQQEAETKFFSRFPTLDRVKHGQDIVTFAKAFRAADPQIDPNTLIDVVGTAIMSKYGIAAAPPVPKPATPVAFAPANSGSVVHRQQVEQTGFEGLGMDFD